MNPTYKITSKIKVLLISLLMSSGVLAQDSNYLPPIIDLLLHESRLEQVMNAYENPNSGHIFIAAHRGGKDYAISDPLRQPGNSIANIDSSLSKGFDLYESDIEILGDGTLVVFHDNDFNALTNCNAVPQCFDPDGPTLLDDKDVDFLDEIFLTHDNGDVSDQRIPTLEEFLTAAKGKIMVKFDLKSGTFGNSTLQRIFDTVVATGTVDQVLIRGGDNLLSVAATNDYDTRMIMRRYDTAPTDPNVITDLAAAYDVRAISFPNGASAEVIAAANTAKLVVEIHELSGFSDAERQAAIADGVRQIHSFKPSLLLEYLKANNHRRF